MTPRQRLRQTVWDFTGGQCEWPHCDTTADELAHITPRGMGHTGYRDRLDNVMAACTFHARITDDLNAPQWIDIHRGYPGTAYGNRLMLARHISLQRIASGIDIPATQKELDHDQPT